ncbi:MAG: hypothetical protein RBT11_18550 [Desulfobacterales bacterium]|jgi:hypothetical protein|nr:hypothetical protein [Desulfobacterales bacterium]
MSHDHTHDHKHDHHPHHQESHHTHGHSHDVSSSLSFEEKLIKLLDHWIKHNADHAATYTEWADRSKGVHLEAVAGLLTEAAEISRSVNAKFEAALTLLKNA